VRSVQKSPAAPRVTRWSRHGESVEVRVYPYAPAAMSDPEAARYVGLGETLFRQVMARDGVKPVRPTVGRKVWRRKDLEAWLDRMAGDAAPGQEPNSWPTLEPNP
jgi:hypothetical protein